MKYITALIAAFALLAAGAPAMADNDTLLHLRASEIPTCYTLGASAPCLQALTGDRGDTTFDWFCTYPTSAVACAYEDEDPGVRAWTDVLYSALDKAHRLLDQRAVKIAAQQTTIDILRCKVRRLRHHHSPKVCF